MGHRINWPGSHITIVDVKLQFSANGQLLLKNPYLISPPLPGCARSNKPQALAYCVNETWACGPFLPKQTMSAT